MGRSRLSTSFAAHALSSVAVALALLSQATTLVHMGAVRHETCAEHGDLVEGDGHDVAPSQPSSSGNADADEHDHCLVASTPSIVEQLTAVTSVIAVAEMDGRIVAPQPRIARVNVLHAAPKTSPPRGSFRTPR